MSTFIYCVGIRMGVGFEWLERPAQAAGTQKPRSNEPEGECRCGRKAFLPLKLRAFLSLSPSEPGTSAHNLRDGLRSRQAGTGSEVVKENREKSRRPFEESKDREPKIRVRVKARPPVPPAPMFIKCPEIFRL